MIKRTFGSRVVLAGLGLILFVSAVAVIPRAVSWKAGTLTAVEVALTELERLEERRASLSETLLGFDDGHIDGLLWVAEERGLAAAQVQAWVNELSIRSGVSIRSIAPAADSTLQEVEVTTLRLEAEAPLDAWVRFLRELEYNQPVILIEKATLRRLSRPGTTTAQPQLFAQLDVSAPLGIVSGRER